MRLPVRQTVPSGVVVMLLLAGSLVGCGSSPAPQPAPTPSFSQAPVETYTDTEEASAAESLSKPLTAAEKAMLDRVRLVGVSIGADGQYVVVRFKAPPRLADAWRNQAMSVTDESTDRVYDQIPTMPLIGLLYASPHKEGQAGYVVFLNDPPLRTGARLRVVLGDFEQVHVAIRGGGEQ